MRNRKAIKEDRQGAIDFFADLEDAEKAVPVLLDRFEYSLDHGINDSREKESQHEGHHATRRKDAWSSKNRLRQTTKIAWPMKILESSGVDRNEIADALISCLDTKDVSFDQNAVDKNYDILCYLIDYEIGDRARLILPFLKDPDERVRFASLEVLLAQKPGLTDLSSLLEHFLLDDSPENRRLRALVERCLYRKKLEAPSTTICPRGSWRDAGVPSADSLA